MFSVIIPVYNVADYIAECIDSVLAQEPGVVAQIILIDDGSVDDSGKICDAYASRYDGIKVIHKKNGGLSDARNAGIREAAGEYVLFVDGDDKIAGGSLRDIRDEIVRQDFPDVVFLECVKVYYNAAGKAVKTAPMGDGVTEEVCALSGAKLLYYLAALPKYPASACTKAIKRELFEKHGLCFSKGRLHEDLEWCVRLLLCIKTAGYCGREYYRYRQHRTGSITDTLCEKSAWDILWSTQRWTAGRSSCRSKAERYLVSSLAEYMFRFLLVEEILVPQERKAEYYKKVRTCSQVLGTRRDTASRLTAAAYKMFGIRISGRLLRLYLKVRRQG